MRKNKNQLNIFERHDPDNDMIPCLLCDLTFHRGPIMYFSPTELDSNIVEFTNYENAMKWKRIWKNTQPKTD